MVNQTSAQKFLLKEVIEPTQTIDDGNYIIHSALDNNKVLDVYMGRTTNYTNVQLYDVANYRNNAQIWNIKYLGGGYYSISTLLDSNKVLDLQNNDAVNGGKYSNI